MAHSHVFDTNDTSCKQDVLEINSPDALDYLAERCGSYPYIAPALDQLASQIMENASELTRQARLQVFGQDQKTRDEAMAVIEAITAKAKIDGF